MNGRLRSSTNATGNRRLDTRVVRGLLAALLTVWGTLPGGAAEPTKAERAAYEQSFEGYCHSVEDFLDSRPHKTSGAGPVNTEEFLLKWGREQGIQGLEGEIPLSRRRRALDLVYREIMRKYLPDVTVADKAPDAGVKVTVGEPRVVMWAPQGKTADLKGNIAKLGHLGPTLAREGRWGQYMFPQIAKLRGGMLIVQVYVGGDGPVGRTYRYYASDDHGRNWRHFACYDDVTERPASEIALRLADGEELRGPLEADTVKQEGVDWVIDVAGLNLKTYAGFFRLGDLPKEKQGVPIYTRKPGQEQWTRETAFWDPDLLIRAERGTWRQLPSPIYTSESHIVHLPDGSLVTTVLRLPVMVDVGPDGTLKAAGHQIWRSVDRGRTWKLEGKIPGCTFLPFWLPGQATIRAHLLALPNGNWVASFRHGGMYSSGGGPMVVRKSSDQGKTWSAPKAIRVPGVNPLGLALENGIAVLSYQRPGVFLTFCADGKGDLWGNDVTLVKGWRHQRNENSCANGSFVVTGPDRFIYAYTKWDVPDPWGQPRQAVIAQEFIVSKK